MLTYNMYIYIGIIIVFIIIIFGILIYYNFIKKSECKYDNDSNDDKKRNILDSKINCPLKRIYNINDNYGSISIDDRLDTNVDPNNFGCIYTRPSTFAFSNTGDYSSLTSCPSSTETPYIMIGERKLFENVKSGDNLEAVKSFDYYGETKKDDKFTCYYIGRNANGNILTYKTN